MRKGASTWKDSKIMIKAFLKSHQRPLKAALCLLAVISLPSCRLGMVHMNLSDRVEGLCNGGEYRGVDADYSSSPSWRVLNDELVKLADEEGKIHYYVPISISTKLRDKPYLTYAIGDGTSRHLFGEELTLGGGERKRAESPKKVYAPLKLPESKSQARKLFAALHLDSSEHALNQLGRSSQSYRLHDSPSKGYREIARIPVPQLEKKLRAAGYDFPASSYLTGTNSAGKIAATTTRIVADIPLSIVGTTGAMIYENTFGWLLSAFD